MPGRLQMTLLACVISTAIGGCGASQDPTIPQANSDSLITLLNAVEADVAGGDCELAAGHAQEFLDGVNLLPATVDSEVKQGLQEAAARLRELTSDPAQCVAKSGTSDAGAVQPTDTSSTTTSAAPTTETSTTTTEPDTSTDEQPPSDGSNGNGPPQTPPGQAPGGGAAGGGTPGSGGIEIEPKR